MLQRAGGSLAGVEDGVGVGTEGRGHERVAYVAGCGGWGGGAGWTEDGWMRLCWGVGGRGVVLSARIQTMMSFKMELRHVHVGHINLTWCLAFSWQVTKVALKRSL